MKDLTPTEGQAYAMQMREHKKHKCRRCKNRIDIGVKFICRSGKDALDVMLDSREQCNKFIFQEDSEKWREKETGGLGHLPI